MDNETTENLNSTNEGQENIDSTNDETVEAEETQQETTEQFTDREKKLYARLKKTEQELNTLKSGSKPKVTSNKSEETNLSTKDIYSLMQAQVPEEDIDEVVKASKLLGKTIQEALKDPVVSAILKRNDEYRKTAQASNAGKAKAGVKTPTPDEIMRQASEGKVPEKGSKEAEELFWAKRGGRR